MFVIQGPQSLAGDVSISGSKNAALPLLAAGLLFDTFTLHNVPHIRDILVFLDIFRSLGIKVDFTENTVTLDTTHISMDHFDSTGVQKIRVGIFLFPAILRRFEELHIPFPGGCNIGKRPIDEHLLAFEAFGYNNHSTENTVHFTGKSHNDDVQIFGGFSVTATENAIIMAASRRGKTTIHISALEPHVIALVEFFRSLSISITIDHHHTITIDTTSDLPKHASTTVIPDYIESGTFIILGALTAAPSITIRHAQINDLGLFLVKCQQAGVIMDIDHAENRITVYNSINSLKNIKLQTNIYPGFPTDLQSPFALLLTQASGTSQIQEVLFEGRLNWLVELEKMRGHIAILNPHEALIFGKTSLRGATVSSWDLRAGVTMIIAGMIATGETCITNVEYIERGYENIVEKIQKLGGKIDIIS